MWVREYEEVPASILRQEDFRDGSYVGEDFTVRRGIDVSEHQGVIDWAAVAEDGVEFAVLRAGYRGYGESGILCPDARFAENMAGAWEERAPHRICSYIYELANDFNRFYHETKILSNSCCNIAYVYY